MSLWDKFRRGLTRTRDALTGVVGAALGRRTLDPATVEQLEHALLAADVGPATTDRLIAEARKLLDKDHAIDLRTALERAAVSLVGANRATFAPGVPGEPGSPWVALLVGVNGVGKTTFAGKLAASYAKAGKKTLLVAADTFRAAATEQLDVWAERAGVEIVRGAGSADPAAVTHDGISAARARGADVVLVDTAGRLHTKHNLMAELQKVARVCARVVPGAPHHVLLVLDGTQGLNGLAQARAFTTTVPVTSLAVTKLDGTSRGGVVLAIAGELGLPVSLVGLGEGLDDWQPFDAEAYAKGLFE
ncbi:MAG TPA: signal recognition particle-docking protein FtsY [Methylomirabilota bacterium]|jgi:fused signal recognition particle receptor|nr:signal recognition particle-docking protein FtsY [Methylomirabilota bacterium]